MVSKQRRLHGAGTVAVTVDEGDDIKCTITNTRKSGAMKLLKDWVGTAGNVDLSIKQGDTVKTTGTANGVDGATPRRVE